MNPESIRTQDLVNTTYSYYIQMLVWLGRAEEKLVAIHWNAVIPNL